MSRKEKIYKFLAVAYNVDPKLVDNRTSRLMKIKAFRSDSAEKIARQRIEKLDKQTGCKWTLHRDPGKLTDRQKLTYRVSRLLGRANDAIWEIIKSHGDLWGELDEMVQTVQYVSAKDPDRVRMKIELLRGKIGDSELLREASEFVKLASLELTGR